MRFKYQLIIISIRVLNLLGYLYKKLVKQFKNKVNRTKTTGIGERNFSQF